NAIAPAAAAPTTMPRTSEKRCSLIARSIGTTLPSRPWRCPLAQGKIHISGRPWHLITAALAFQQTSPSGARRRSPDTSRERRTSHLAPRLRRHTDQPSRLSLAENGWIPPRLRPDLSAFCQHPADSRPLSLHRCGITA